MPNCAIFANRCDSEYEGSILSAATMWHNTRQNINLVEIKRLENDFVIVAYFKTCSKTPRLRLLTDDDHSHTFQSPQGCLLDMEEVHGECQSDDVRLPLTTAE